MKKILLTALILESISAFKSQEIIKEQPSLSPFLCDVLKKGNSQENNKQGDGQNNNFDKTFQKTGRTNDTLLKPAKPGIKNTRKFPRRRHPHIL